DRAAHALRFGGEPEDGPRAGHHLPERDHAPGHRGHRVTRRSARGATAILTRMRGIWWVPRNACAAVAFNTSGGMWVPRPTPWLVVVALGGLGGRSCALDPPAGSGCWSS